MRIPIYRGALCVELADPIRARRLGQASNAETVRRKRDGRIMQINLMDVADESERRPSFCNPRKYTYLDCSERMPQGVHALKHLPDHTASLYRQVRIDCMA